MELTYFMCFGFLYFFLSFAFTLTESTPEFTHDFDDVNKQQHALILTDYINAGKIEEARTLSRVYLKDAEDVESYSGFMKVDEKCNSNMFFWFFPSQRKSANDSVILWLQGGPGVSSMYGLLYEVGPFYVDKGDVLKRRKYNWSDKMNLLFIDSPVGTGFSFTKDNEICHAHNQNDVMKNLYETVLQFFKLFPELQRNDFFIFGESYAGKYAPTLAHSIHENNEKSKVKINMKGLSIGNGFSDPIHMVNYSELVYNLGLINDNGRRKLKVLEEKTVSLIEAQNFTEVFTSVEVITSLIQNMTCGMSFSNYLEESRALTNDTYLSREDVKSAIHAIGINFTYYNPVVGSYLRDDLGISVKPFIEKLLKNYRIMFYSGQVDITVGAVQTQNFLRTLNWSGAKEFQNRSQFGVMMSESNSKVAVAYGTEYGNLLEYRIRKAGHMVPVDQPKVLYNIMQAFVNNRSLQYIDL